MNASCLVRTCHSVSVRGPERHLEPLRRVVVCPVLAKEVQPDDQVLLRAAPCSEVRAQVGRGNLSGQTGNVSNRYLT